MKTRIKLISSIAVVAMFFTACDKTEKPVIDVHEFGYENSAAASPGGDLHIDAEIVATGTIDEVRVEIHAEADHMKAGGAGLEWEVDTVFTEFNGLKNAEFHEHIEIPADAPLGDYHFHMSVTDLEGYQGSFESDLEIKEGVEHDH